MSEESMSTELREQLSPEEIVALKTELGGGRNADAYTLENKVAVAIVTEFHGENGKLVRNGEDTSSTAAPADRGRAIALRAIQMFDALQIAVNTPGSHWSNEFPVEWAAQGLAAVKEREAAQIPPPQGGPQEQHG